MAPGWTVDGARPRSTSPIDLAGAAVDDRDRVAAGAPQRHRRRRELVGLARGRTCRRAARAARPRRPAPRRIRASAAPDVAASAASSGAFVRGAQQVRGVELLVLVVEDRGLDRPLQELVGMAAEELVERVLARDVDREPAAAPPGAAPHLAQRRDGPRERHADRGIQRPDVDPQLQRIGRHDAEQLAVHQPPLELAPLRRRVARPVRRDPLGQRRDARAASAPATRSAPSARPPCATS